MTKKEILKNPDEITTPSSTLTENTEASLEDLGIEGVSLSMSSIPVLKLTQAMTPEVQDRAYKEIQSGMFIDDSTKTVVGDGEVTVRVLRIWKQRTKFMPRDAGGMIECSCPTYTPNDHGTDVGTEHGVCSTCMYNNFNEADHCQTQGYAVVSVNDDPNQLYRIILSKTSFKAYGKLEKLLQGQARRFKRQSFVFPIVVKAKEETSKTGNRWNVWDFELAPVKPDAFISDDLVDEFMFVFDEITDLRKAMLEDHKARVAANASRDNLVSAASADMTTMGDQLASEFGITGSAANTEDVPF